MRWRELLLMGLLMAALPSVAQQVASDYQARFRSLAKAHAKHPQDVEHLYGLALFYFDNSHPMRDLPTAMHYATLAEARHTELLNQDKISELARLQKSGITLPVIRQMKTSIAEAAKAGVRMNQPLPLAQIGRYLEAFGSDVEMAKMLRSMRMRQLYQHALEQGTAAECYSFVQTYASTDEATAVEQRLATLVASEAKELSAREQVLALQEQYPKSIAVRSAINRRLAQIDYEAARLRGTREDYVDFLTIHPASNEAELAREQIDRLTENDLMHRRNAMALAHFADSNADSPLADKALARMRKLIYRNHDTEAARYYVNHYPLDPYTSEVYSRYYSWYSAEGSAALLKAFADLNPDFPFYSALENDRDRIEPYESLDLTLPYTDSLHYPYADFIRANRGKNIALVPLQRMLQKHWDRGNYAAAAAQMEEFTDDFENVTADQYRALHRLITTQPAIRAVQPILSDSLPVLHPVINPADGMLYYSAGSLICRAKKKGKGWQLYDTLRIENAGNAALTVFSFYDNGNGMVLGYEGDIWLAERDGIAAAWRVSDIPPYPVNTDYIETDAYMLPDGSGMLLASDRPGGFNLLPSGTYFHGDTALATDLYFIPRNGAGWGRAINLGLGVNSPYAERSPLLSQNLRTLYFITDAPTGLGYGDVYVCERESSDDWTSWTTPRNLGREVNSPFRETSISFGPGEKTIILSSNLRQSKCEAFSFPTTHNVATGVSHLQVDLSEANQALLRMQVVDLTKQNIAQVLDYAGDSLSLGLDLDASHRYAIVADGGNMLVATTMIDPSQQVPYRMSAYTYAELVAMDRTVDLPLVTTRSGSTELQPLALVQLQQLTRFVQHYPQCKLEFLIDAAGDDAPRCYTDSQLVGYAIRNYLTSLGLPSAQVLLSPYGNARQKKGSAITVSVRFRE